MCCACSIYKETGIACKHHLYTIFASFKEMLNAQYLMCMHV